MITEAQPKAAVRPTVLAVDTDPESIDRLGRELAKRYGEDYRVECASSIAEAEHVLASMRAYESPLAIALVDNAPGAERVLSRAKAVYPRSRRALLLTPSGPDSLAGVPAAMSHGLADLVVVKPFANTTSSSTAP